MRCPSCRTLLGNKQIYYEKHLDEICKKYELGEIKTQEEYDEMRNNLVNSIIVNQSRYCCKARLMTYLQLVKIVK